ncbi:MAG: hypothetical protein VX319_13845 [Bacteroidota bacterium]|nr:hypothetical protein [Bacteroidota bacterium]
MKANHILLLFILLLNFKGFAQDSTNAKSGANLPDSDATVPEDGAFLPNAIQEYNEAYYVINRLNMPNGLPPNKLNFQSPQANL